MSIAILANVAGNQTEGAAPLSRFNNPNDREYGLVQVSIPSGATVSIRGRTSNNMPWLELTSFTASAGTRVTLFNEMIAVVSGHDSGTIRVEIVD